MAVTARERNPSRDAPVHFLQIWLLPERARLKPGYEQKTFGEDERRGKLRLVASHDGRDGSIVVHQDVALWSGLLDAVPSDHNGLLYCIGTRMESGVNIVEDIRAFGRRGKGESNKPG